jgi:hypothetical protein
VQPVNKGGVARVQLFVAQLEEKGSVLASVFAERWIDLRQAVNDRLVGMDLAIPLARSREVSGAG